MQKMSMFNLKLTQFEETSIEQRSDSNIGVPISDEECKDQCTEDLIEKMGELEISRKSKEEEHNAILRDINCRMKYLEEQEIKREDTNKLRVSNWLQNNKDFEENRSLKLETTIKDLHSQISLIENNCKCETRSKTTFNRAQIDEEFILGQLDHLNQLTSTLEGCLANTITSINNNFIPMAVNTRRLATGVGNRLDAFWDSRNRKRFTKLRMMRS